MCHTKQILAFCLLPISKAEARTLSGYEPLDIPKNVLPSFPDGMHPLIIQAGYNNDIRMTALNLVPLQIPSLMQGSLILPYVDVTKDGKTPINTPINNYVGGTDGHDLQALVPAIAAGISPFEGTDTFPASFAPDNAVVESLPDGLYSISVKPYLLPNTVSGPGIYAEAFDMLYTLTQTSPYTDHTFHDLLNRPQLLNNGKCQRNQLYFNGSFADPKMAVANVTLYHQILSTPPALIEGQYTNVHCYLANAEQVGDTGETCASAAAKVDPMALQ